MKLRTGTIDTPIGELGYVTNEKGVCALGFTEGWEKLDRGLTKRFGKFEPEPGGDKELERRMRAYFAGDVHTLDSLKVDLGGTPFQQTVWDALRRIPTGTTLSYGELAREIGREGSQRAVANANARNPVSLIVPCHRVIGANGTLTGYGWGIERKKWLLDHEAVGTSRQAVG